MWPQPPSSGQNSAVPAYQSVARDAGHLVGPAEVERHALGDRSREGLDLDPYRMLRSLSLGLGVRGAQRRHGLLEGGEPGGARGLAVDAAGVDEVPYAQDRAIARERVRVDLGVGSLVRDREDRVGAVDHRLARRPHDGGRLVEPGDGGVAGGEGVGDRDEVGVPLPGGSELGGLVEAPGDRPGGRRGGLEDRAQLRRVGPEPVDLLGCDEVAVGDGLERLGPRRDDLGAVERPLVRVDRLRELGLGRGQPRPRLLVRRRRDQLVPEQPESDREGGGADDDRTTEGRPRGRGSRRRGRRSPAAAGRAVTRSASPCGRARDRPRSPRRAAPPDPHGPLHAIGRPAGGQTTLAGVGWRRGHDPITRRRVPAPCPRRR